MFPITSCNVDAGSAGNVLEKPKMQ